MHTLHLTDLDTTRQIKAIKGLRAARKALGLHHRATLIRCKEAVDAFRSGNFVLVGDHDDLSVVRDAALQLEVESAGAARGEVDLNDDEASESAENWLAEQKPPSLTESEDAEHVSIGYDACKTALVLMCMTGGNPAYVVAAAKSLAMSTGDEELYAEVVNFLEDTFPPSE